MEAPIQIEWIAAGSIFMGSIVSAGIAAAAGVMVAHIQGRNAIARETMILAQQERMATALLASHEKARQAAERATASTIETAQVMDVVAGNVAKIELATNSMKDALIEATAKAEGLAGEKRGIEQEAERARTAMSGA